MQPPCQELPQYLFSDLAALPNKRRTRAGKCRNAYYYTKHPEQIPQRLRELDEEWDVERVLEVNSSALTITGILLSLVRGKKWLLMSAAVQGFFLQHALQGWCPPLPILRKLGIRTQREIDEERFGLMRLRDAESRGNKSKNSRHDAMTR